MDNVDRKIIKFMEKDANQSIPKMSKILSINAATLRRRIIRLISKNIIKIVAIVNPEEAGFPLSVLITLNVDPEKTYSIVSILNNRPEPRWAYATAGRWDIVTMVQFRDHAELSNFLENVISKIPGVKNSESSLCLVSKGNYYVQDVI
ncbi:Lrp/AsnC family transcriptional regulator [Chloroflexota bacterium]